jgi:Na+-driven multidrug efflux pump
LKAASQKKSLDMLHGTLWDKIPRFAVPVAATAILSQLFNAADIAVIGNFTGELRTVAVAAVGTNSSIISLFIGIALGANVTIAHAIGEKNDTMVHHAVHTSIVVAVLGGLIAAVIGELFAVPLLNQLNVPDDVFPLALLYLRIYLAGLPVILLYNFEAAVFRSVGETKIPLIALTASGVLNVILNLFFVAALHMSVDGVAIATVLSNAVSAAILWGFLLKNGQGHPP